MTEKRGVIVAATTPNTVAALSASHAKEWHCRCLRRDNMHGGST
jgi:hypothetical protein